MRMTVDCKVGCILKEFIISTNGSDKLDPDKNSFLWALVKQHLVTLSSSNPVIDRKEYISILMRYNESAKMYSVPSQKIVSINTLFRCYISEKGQAVIRKHFEKEFKKTFHDYMKGAMNNTDLQIKDAIEEFCNDHNLSLDRVSFDMLKKDWYRYRMKKQIQEICPLVF